MAQELSTRFEELRKECDEWVKVNGPSGLLGPFPTRSCWNCNGAHEHLRRADYPIQCYDCGHIYFKGERISDDDDGSSDPA